MPRLPSAPAAVTFDCWGTLVYETAPSVARSIRLDALAEVARSLAIDGDPSRESHALDLAWRRHWDLWHRGVASGPREMAEWALVELGADAPEPGILDTLGERFAEASLEQDIRPLDGARETLELLAGRSVRRALICDTGFTPGRVLRRILDRSGLLDLLEVQIFSNEVGFPKPDPRVFRMALEPFSVEPERAVHVGDLRRTDVAGARGVGMGSVRLRWHYDDRSDHPEADVVADSHEHLRKILSPD